jgi:hypothetical protein
MKRESGALANYPVQPASAPDSLPTEPADVSSNARLGGAAGPARLLSLPKLKCQPEPWGVLWIKVEH